MYGVVATQKQQRSKTRARKEQNAEEKREMKKRSLPSKFIQYLKRRLNPQPAEEAEECGVAARPRPEPPAALERSSRFSRHEIKLMYRGFKQECPTGVVDEESFKNIFCQFFPLGDASQYAHYVFNTIKHKHTGKADFESLLSALSLAGRGSAREKVSWVFALYSAAGGESREAGGVSREAGGVSRDKLAAVTRAVYAMLGAPLAAEADRHVDNIFHLMDRDADGLVSREELWGWVSRDEALLRSLDALDTVL